MVRLISVLASLCTPRGVCSGLCALLLCSAMPAGAQQQPPQPPQSGAPSGRAIYNARCYVCHGYSGDARTLAARMLHPPPRDFTGLAPAQRSRADMIDTVTHGRPGTAMQAFAGLLSPAEIAAVVDFVRSEFMQARRRNRRYHSRANGWPDFERYALAAPFATGELALDTPWERMDARQQAGWKRFFTTCISCHDRGRVNDPEVTWERQALSYPRYVEPPGGEPDGAEDDADAVYERHEVPPRLAAPTPRERQGQAVFQTNCAHCHGADGSGRNWIGRFLQPHPPDLHGAAVLAAGQRGRLRAILRDGVPGSAMPAWGQVLDDAQIDAVMAYLVRAFH